MARDKQTAGSSRSLAGQGVSVTYGIPPAAGTPGSIVTGTGADWFGPLNPIAPIAPPDVKGRILDYPSGYNLNVRPRAYNAITFDMLRAFADAYDLLRILIETRKDQMARLEWNIVPRDKKLLRRGATIPGDIDKRISTIREFFLMPDKENFWGDWLRLLLEDLFVIDAPTIYRRKTIGGELYALQPIDGGTIKRVIDDFGNVPEFPAPAYQQVLKGYPAVDYTTEELIYRPRVKRTNRIYGYSQVEQILMTINIGMRRQTWQLESFTEGNVPEALIGTPDSWTPDQVRQFQEWFDGMLTGNTGERRRARFVPGGVAKGYVPTKPTELFGEAEEWLVRVMCFAFSVSPQPFVKMMNRSTAETAQETAAAEGLAPIQNWVKGLMDLILIQDFKSPDLEFKWLEEDELDPDIKSKIVDREQAAGRLSFNEARSEQGLDPIDHPNADRPMFKSKDGWVPIFLTPEEEAEKEAAAQAMKDALDQGGDEEDEPGEDGGDAPSGEGDEEPEDGDVEKAAGSQPRVPSGSSKGGQFASGKGGAAVAHGGSDATGHGSGGSSASVSPEISAHVDAIGKHQARLDAKSIERQHGRNPAKARELASSHEKTAQNYTRAGVSANIVGQVQSQASHLRGIADKWESATKADQLDDEGVAEKSDVPFVHGACSLAKAGADLGFDRETLDYPDPMRAFAQKHETKLSAFLVKLLKRLGKDVSKQVRAKLDEVAKAEYPDEYDVEALLASLDLEVFALSLDELQEALDAVGQDAGRIALGSMGISADDQKITDVVNLRALEYAKDRAAELVSFDDVDPMLAASTRDMLRATISNGIEGNLSTKQIGDALESLYAFSEDRAQTIAATEITRANSEAALSSYKAAETVGIKTKKSWLKLEDACPICASNAAAGQIDLDEEFPSGDMTPGAHPHCRCVLVPHVIEEKATKADLSKADNHDDMSKHFPVNLDLRFEPWKMGGNNEAALAERMAALLIYVPFDQCIATQDYCDRDKVKVYLDDPTAKGFAPMAYQMDVDGEPMFAIQDGHHRAVASRLSGNSGMTMNVKQVGSLEKAEQSRVPAGSSKGGQFASSKAGLQTYIGDDPYANSVGINAKLREGHSLEPSEQSTLDAVNQAFEHYGVEHSGGVVYRGTEGKVHGDAGSISSPHPISTSTDISVAHEFASQGDRGHVYEVAIPKGTKVIHTSEFALEGMKYQKEILLPKGKIEYRSERKDLKTHYDAKLGVTVHRMKFVPD